MLTVKQIDAAKPTEKSYRLPDAGGLFLFVPPSGKKVWPCGTGSTGRKKRWLSVRTLKYLSQRPGQNSQKQK